MSQRTMLQGSSSNCHSSSSMFGANRGFFSMNIYRAERLFDVLFNIFGHFEVVGCLRLVRAHLFQESWKVIGYFKTHIHIYTTTYVCCRNELSPYSSQIKAICSYPKDARQASLLTSFKSRLAKGQNDFRFVVQLNLHQAAAISRH